MSFINYTLDREKLEAIDRGEGYMDYEEDTYLGQDTGKIIGEKEDKMTEAIEDTKDIQDTLAEREVTYGAFIQFAEVSQGLKSAITNHPNWDSLTPDKKEALSMVLHKVARIINGDQNYIESWRDMVGYTQLVIDTLLKTEGATDGRVVKQVVKDGKLVDAGTGVIGKARDIEPYSETKHG